MFGSWQAAGWGTLVSSTWRLQQAGSGSFTCCSQPPKGITRANPKASACIMLTSPCPKRAPWASPESMRCGRDYTDQGKKEGKNAASFAI